MRPKAFKKVHQTMKSLFGENLIAGWRSIAGYLGRSVSTAKRYKKYHSLPVRSFPSGRPYVFRFELDKYMLILDDYMSGRRKIKSTRRGNHRRQRETANREGGDSAPNRPPIPIQIGHPIRLKSATDSEANRPGIPIQTGHPLEG